MRIIIDVPDEFFIDFESDRLEDTFNRVINELRYNIQMNGYGVVGNYEMETLQMLKESLTDWEYANWEDAPYNKGRVIE